MMFAHFPWFAALLTSSLVAGSAHCTPAAFPKEKLVQCSYPVADLVIPLPCVEAGPEKGPGQTEKLGKTQATLEKLLIRLIQQTVAPASWSRNGGPGTICYFPLGMSLHVCQTPAVQEQVAELLSFLHRQQEVEVALEVRLLTLPDDSPCPAKCTKVAGREEARPAFLNDLQVHRLLEYVQGDRRANVMQAPKMTLFNGQAAKLNLTENQFFMTHVDVVGSGEKRFCRPNNEPTKLGLCMTAQPVVSADRRFVRLYLKIDQTELASPVVPLLPVTIPMEKIGTGEAVPFSFYLQQPRLATLNIEKTVAIPDRGTVIFAGCKKVKEVSYESRAPVLGDIPFLNTLFNNIAYRPESEKVLVLVTPRIIVNEEAEETRQVAADPPCDPVQKSCPAGWNPRPCVACPQPPLAHPGNPSVGEEQEAPPPCESLSVQRAKAVAELLRAYEAACAAGQAAEAKKIARAALALDPMCFRKTP
jgi:hypothetical protein